MKPVARAAARALLLLLLCAWWGTARAQTPPRLLLLDRGSPALARKLRAEAAFAGLVLHAAPEVASDREPNVELLEQSGAAALVSVDSEDSLQLLLAQRQGHGSKRLSLQRGNEGESFALRAIEQLRVSLVDLGWALPGAAAPQDVPSVAPRAPTPSVSSRVADADYYASVPVGQRGAWRWWLNGGVSALGAPGGIGVSVHGLLGVQLEWAGAWSLGAFALLPFYDNEIHGAEGEADVSVDLYLLQLGYADGFGAKWRWSAALGPGLLVLPLEAEARPPWQGKTNRVVSGAGVLELSMARELNGWLRLRASVLAGLCAPRPVVSFAGRDAASWGRWFGGLSLRAELGVPPVELPE